MTRPKPAHNRQPWLVFAIIVGVIVGLPALFYVGRIVFGISALVIGDQSLETQGRKDAVAVAAEMSRYSFIHGCTLTGYWEQPAGIDAQYAYHGTYSCPATTIGALHDQIVDDLAGLGYKRNIYADDLFNPQTPFPSSRYGDSPVTGYYDTAKFDAAIGFSSISGPGAATSLDQLRAEPANGFSLVVTARPPAN